jgi:hypothetical protein
MFKSSNQKLVQARELVARVAADLDTLLADIRQVRRLNFSRDGSTGEPDYVRRICQQRETLATVAAMLADMRLEWSQVPPDECDGHCNECEASG